MDSKWVRVKKGVVGNLRSLSSESGSLARADAGLVLSPYDTPEAVRGFYDEISHKCVIEYKYMGQKEGLKEEVLDSHVIIKIGENSKRLYRIEITNQTAPCRDNVGLLHSEVSKELNALVGRVKSLREKGNYTVAKDIFEAREGEIFECGVH